MATAYISRTFGTPTDEDKWTLSFWYKKCGPTSGVRVLDADGGGNEGNISFDATTGKLNFYQYQSSLDTQLITKNYYRDVGAFYHVVVIFDAANGTPADRAQIWVNGARVTTLGTATYPTTLYSQINKSGVVHYIGAKGSTGDKYCDGVFSHMNFVDGSALAPSYFGEADATSGIWKIKINPDVTYGNNGFFLKFEDRTNLDLDSSPNAHTFTTTGTITPTYDNPSNNFCTLNPLGSDLAGGSLTLGNNYVQFASDSTYRSIYATLGNSTGKYYFEGYVQDDGNATNIGIIDTEQNTGSNQDYTAQTRGYSYNEDGQKYNNGSGSSYGDTYASTNIIGCAVDLTNGAIWFSKNGTWQNSATIAEIGAGTTTNAAFTGLTLGERYLYGPAISGKTNAKWKMNFGNGYFADTAISSEGTNASGIGSFEYDVPTGFTAWSTKGFNE